MRVQDLDYNDPEVKGANDLLSGLVQSAQELCNGMKRPMLLQLAVKETENQSGFDLKRVFEPEQSH